MPTLFKIDNAHRLPLNPDIVDRDGRRHFRTRERGRTTYYPLTSDGKKYLKPGPKWHAEVRHADGRRKRVPLSPNRAAAERMLALPNPPTAFLAASMISGMGVRRAIEGVGLVLGRDVSLIVFDDDLSYMKNGEKTPIFTAMRSSVREAGKLVAELLLDRIANPDQPPAEELLEAELVEGTSTGPAPKR